MPGLPSLSYTFRCSEELRLWEPDILWSLHLQRKARSHESAKVSRSHTVRFSTFSMDPARVRHTVALCALHCALRSVSSPFLPSLKAPAFQLSLGLGDPPKIHGLLIPLLLTCSPTLRLCTPWCPNGQLLELSLKVAAYTESCRPHPWLYDRFRMDHHQV